MLRLRVALVLALAGLFALGALARALPTPSGAPACHMTDMTQPMPGHPDSKAMLGDCCLACMPLEVAKFDPAPIPTAAARPAVYAMVTPRLEGRVLTPEPGPPRRA